MDRMKYFTPSKWIARIMVSWGIVTICTAAVSSYAGMVVCRIFIGITEAGFFVSIAPHSILLLSLYDFIADSQPGVMMYLCFWYKPDERATRMAIFAASIAVAG
jgi:uncharacterized protein YodC (DUF2158 family)